MLDLPSLTPTSRPPTRPPVPFAPPAAAGRRAKIFGTRSPQRSARPATRGCPRKNTSRSVCLLSARPFRFRSSLLASSAADAAPGSRPPPICFFSRLLCMHAHPLAPRFCCRGADFSHPPRCNHRPRHFESRCAPLLRQLGETWWWPPPAQRPHNRAIAVVAAPLLHSAPLLSAFAAAFASAQIDDVNRLRESLALAGLNGDGSCSVAESGESAHPRLLSTASISGSGGGGSSRSDLRGGEELHPRVHPTAATFMRVLSMDDPNSVSSAVAAAAVGLGVPGPAIGFQAPVSWARPAGAEAAECLGGGVVPSGLPEALDTAVTPSDQPTLSFSSAGEGMP